MVSEARKKGIVEMDLLTIFRSEETGSAVPATKPTVASKSEHGIIERCMMC